MDKKRNLLIKKTIKEHFLVLFVFIILSLIFTYPVISNITTHSAGDGGDGLQFIWNIWHVNKTISEGGGISDLYYTKYQFYPEGTSLAFHTLSLTNTFFIGFPLTLITSNLVLIYNIIILFNIVLTGFGMYLLINYLIKNKSIAFIVGFAYTFSPLQMVRGLGHLNFFSVGWIPLFFLFFIKTLEKKKIRNAIFSGIFLFLLSLANWYYLLYIFIISSLYFLYSLWKKSITFDKNLLKRLGIFIVLFGVLITPFLSPMITEYLEGEGYQARGKTTHLEPYHYIVPSYLHPLWGEYMQKFQTVNIIESLVFMGYFVLLISVIYLIKTKKQIFWLLLASLFFLFSIFPKNPLLDLLIKIIPFYNVMCNTGRFSFGVLFSLMIMFGFALKYFIPKWEELFEKKFKIKKGFSKFILILIILIIITIEFIPIPYPTSYGYEKEINQIPFFNEKDLDFGEVTILSLPLSYNSKELYLQTHHEIPIIGGYVSRLNPKSQQHLHKIGKNINSREIDVFYGILKKYNIKYLVHYTSGEYWGFYSEINKEDLDYILNNSPLKKISENDFYDAAIYKIS